MSKNFNSPELSKWHAKLFQVSYWTQFNVLEIAFWFNVGLFPKTTTILKIKLNKKVEIGLDKFLTYSNKQN